MDRSEIRSDNFENLHFPRFISYSWVLKTNSYQHSNWAKIKEYFNKIPSVKKESILHQWKQSILMDRRVRFFPLLLDSHMEVSTIKQNVFRTGITEIQIIIITDIAKLGLNHICRLSGSIFSWKQTIPASTAHYIAIF